MTLSEHERRAFQEIVDAVMESDPALVRRLTAPVARRFDPVTRRAVWVFSTVVVMLLVWGLLLGDESMLAGAGLVLVTFPAVAWCMAHARRLGS